MRRRLLSLCLVLCMVLGMLPVAAMATETALLTVSAGGVDYAASYVGTGGESLGESGGVYAVQIPENTAVSIGYSAAATSVSLLKFVSESTWWIAFRTDSG